MAMVFVSKMVLPGQILDTEKDRPQRSVCANYTEYF